jgi:hypothetical protein
LSLVAIFIRVEPEGNKQRIYKIVTTTPLQGSHAEHGQFVGRPNMPAAGGNLEDGHARRAKLSGNGVGGSLLKDSAHIHEVIKAAHEELQQLIRQRAEIMKRIGTLKQTISGLANLFGDEILGEDLMELLDRRAGRRQPGFTRACRVVLIEAGSPLSVREVCDRIQERMPTVLLRHKDPLASVTTVLNRLVDYGEAQSVVRPNGRRAWQWLSDPGAIAERLP